MTATRGHRSAVMPVSMLLVGGGIAVAAWAGGSPGAATGIALAILLAAIGSWVLGRRTTDVGSVLRFDTDERQLQIILRAAAATALVLMVACAVLAIHSLTQSEGGQPYLDLLLLAVLTSGTTFSWLQYRR